jgi:hypothetical protein
MEFGRSSEPQIKGNGLIEVTSNCKLDEFFRASNLIRRIETLEAELIKLKQASRR